MRVIDLGTVTTDAPDGPDTTAVVGAARGADITATRVAVTLRELRFLADALSIRLPVEAPVAEGPAAVLEETMGDPIAGETGSPVEAVDAVLADLPVPAASLVERGLATEGDSDHLTVAPALLRALGAMAMPEVTIDLDVSFTGERGDVRLRGCQMVCVSGLVWRRDHDGHHDVGCDR